MDEESIPDAGAEKARLLENEGVRGDSQERDGAAVASPRGSQGDEPLTRSFMSPTSDNPYGLGSESPVSEKARGKMRERRSGSVETITSLDRVPLTIGRNGFVPTQEWVSVAFFQTFCELTFSIVLGYFVATRVTFPVYRCLSVLLMYLNRLPLDTVMLFISEVVQKVEEMQRHRTVPSADVLKFLSNVNLDHLFPSKPPISARRFVVRHSHRSNPLSHPSNADHIMSILPVV